MIASLPMYDRPETRAAYSTFWQAVRQTWLAVDPDAALPAVLSQPSDLMAHWRDPALVLSQTCGLPFRVALHRDVALYGTPDFALPGCPPGYYNSVLVMRKSDDRQVADWPGMTLALNGFDSQSGWAAPWAYAQAQGVRFGDHVVTGAHRASARVVMDGGADIAAIDAQTWRMLQRWDSWTDGLREAARTEPTPGLPYIAAPGAPVEHRTLLPQALEILPPEHRKALDIAGIVDIDADSYLALPLPPSSAETA